MAAVDTKPLGVQCQVRQAASPKEYVERGRFEQPDRTTLPAWAHPFIANGKLYVRDQDALFCYDVKAR
jgi:alcohol dehydrogenase (cytochrome c)